MKKYVSKIILLIILLNVVACQSSSNTSKGLQISPTKKDESSLTKLYGEGRFVSVDLKNVTKEVAKTLEIKAIRIKDKKSSVLMSVSKPVIEDKNTLNINVAIDSTNPKNIKAVIDWNNDNDLVNGVDLTKYKVDCPENIVKLEENIQLKKGKPQVLLSESYSKACLIDKKVPDYDNLQQYSDLVAIVITYK